MSETSGKFCVRQADQSQGVGTGLSETEIPEREGRDSRAGHRMHLWNLEVVLFLCCVWGLFEVLLHQKKTSDTAVTI